MLSPNFTARLHQLCGPVHCNLLLWLCFQTRFLLLNYFIFRSVDYIDEAIPRPRQLLQSHID